jgi:hypothetical protein
LQLCGEGGEEDAAAESVMQVTWAAGQTSIIL